MSLYRRSLSFALLGAVAALGSLVNAPPARMGALNAAAADFEPGTRRANHKRAKHGHGTGAAAAKRAARRRRNIAKHPRGAR